MESSGEPAGTWTPHQSLLWSQLDILLGSLLHSLLLSILDDCMAGQYLRAAAEICIHWEELSCPRDAFGRWKSPCCWELWQECWQTESTCLSASGTLITITNTIIIAIIARAIVPLPSSLSAMIRMCTHTPTLSAPQGADFPRISESQDPIFYLFCRM